MPSSVVIPRRFNGPPTSGNGGYSCGLLGSLIGDSAEVTLRTPPPLELELSVVVEGGGDERRWRMMNGETLVASGRATEPDVTCPEPVPLSLAREAEARYIGFEEHPFSSCFVCGPDRAEGDGLRLFTGKVEGRELVACSWTPAASVGGPDGNVDTAVVWSALDCPTYFGGRLNGYGAISLLGRLTVKRVAPIRVSSPYVVVGFPLGREGRKWEGGAAIFSADGELCARARGLWVELRS